MTPISMEGYLVSGVVLKFRPMAQRGPSFPSRLSLVSASDSAHNQPIIRKLKELPLWTTESSTFFMQIRTILGNGPFLCSGSFQCSFPIQQQRKRSIAPKHLISELNWSGLSIKVRKRYSWKKRRQPINIWKDVWPFHI